ncbi:unnamed protein product [Orchesella dallaii]
MKYKSPMKKCQSIQTAIKFCLLGINLFFSFHWYFLMFIMARLFFSIVTVGVLNILIGTNSQLGVLYSPFVTPGDDPHSTRSYSLEDIKVMLNLLQDENFHHVSTQSVGAPDEQYSAGSTINKCSSIAPTALAAAQINKEKNKLALSVYQGVSPGSGLSERRLSTEIEIAQAANNIYDGTVTALVLTASAGLPGIPSELPSVLSAATKSRAMNLTFGLSRESCKSTVGILKLANFGQAVFHALESFDFIICPNIPTLDDYSRGPGPFKERITKQVSELEKEMKKMGAKTKVYLETGWASGMNSSNPYELVEQKDFWEMMGQWANAEKRMVFMYEAFDNPWKVDVTEVLPYSSHYGLWKHLDNEKKYSNNSYTRKISKIETYNRGSGKPRNNDASVQRASTEFSGGMTLASFGLIEMLFQIMALNIILCKKNLNW